MATDPVILPWGQVGSHVDAITRLRPAGHACRAQAHGRTLPGAGARRPARGRHRRSRPSGTFPGRRAVDPRDGSARARCGAPAHGKEIRRRPEPRRRIRTGTPRGFRRPPPREPCPRVTNRADPRQRHGVARRKGPACRLGRGPAWPIAPTPDAPRRLPGRLASQAHYGAATPRCGDDRVKWRAGEDCPSQVISMTSGFLDTERRQRVSVGYSTKCLRLGGQDLVKPRAA